MQHWLLRFHALLRLHLVGALSAELSAVTSLLPPAPYLSPNPPSDLPFHPSVPFDLYLLSASLPSLVPDIEGGDKPAAVEALARLLQAAKGEMWRAKRAGDGGTEGEWRERVERVGEVLSGVLSEIKVRFGLPPCGLSAHRPPSLCRPTAPSAPSSPLPPPPQPTRSSPPSRDTTTRQATSLPSRRLDRQQTATRARSACSSALRGPSGTRRRRS